MRLFVHASDREAEMRQVESIERCMQDEAGAQQGGSVGSPGCTSLEPRTRQGQLEVNVDFQGSLFEPAAEGYLVDSP